MRKGLKKYRDLRVSVRNLAGFNIGGSSADIDFVLRGPDLATLFPLRPRGFATRRNPSA